MLGKTEPTPSCQEEISSAGQLKDQSTGEQRCGGEKTHSPPFFLVFTPAQRSPVYLINQVVSPRTHSALGYHTKGDSMASPQSCVSGRNGTEVSGNLEE